MAEPETGRSADAVSDGTATVESLRQMMRDFMHERDWEKYHTPRNLAASVSVEAGELLELFQWLTAEEALAKSRGDAPFRQAVGEEIADVLMYLMSLANVMEMDIATTVKLKMEKNRLKYPAELFRGRYERPLKS